MTSLLDLPFELLTHIFTFLSYSDRAALRATCKILYEVGSQTQFTKREILVVEETTISPEHDPLLKICRSSRKFTRFIFQRVDIIYNSQFWIDCGNDIISLSFSFCEMDSDCLFNILSNCPHLQSLKLENVSQLFMMFRPTGFGITLPYLKSLELQSSRYITDMIFSSFTNMCPYLNHLSIHNCENFCHPGIYNRFYPQRLKEIANPSDAIFSFLFIQHVVEIKASHLTSLDFSNTMINAEYMISILETENLKLTKLNISNCAQLRIPNFSIISRLQPNLQHLVIKYVPGCSMEVLTNPLPDLIILKMDGLQRTVTPAEIRGPLYKLEELSMSNSDPAAVQTMIEVLLNISQPKLKILVLESIDLSRDILSKAVKHFTKLTSLNLGNTVVAVDDNVLKMIFENLLLLTELHLTNCEGITDRGLMGIDLETVPAVTTKKSSLLRIPLGSKVETEIREDFARKQTIMQIMDETAQPTGASIMHLQGLRILSLRSCIHISDLSLKTVFKFRDLIYLDIAECQQITHEGLAAMAPNVPSIETLDLASCYNIDDKAVEVVCKGLKRLKCLILDDCRQLTNKTLESALYDSTSVLHIKVRGCEKMDYELIHMAEELLEHRREF